MEEYKSEVKQDLIISAICFVAGLILGLTQQQGLFGALMWGAAIGGLRYGWKVLTFITPSVFLIMPLIGWVIYFVIKFCIAIFISPFAFVIKTIMNIIALKTN